MLRQSMDKVQATVNNIRENVLTALNNCSSIETDSQRLVKTFEDLKAERAIESKQKETDQNKNRDNSDTIVQNRDKTNV